MASVVEGEEHVVPCFDDAGHAADGGSPHDVVAVCAELFGEGMTGLSIDPQLFAHFGLGPVRAGVVGPLGAYERIEGVEIFEGQGVHGLEVPLSLSVTTRGASRPARPVVVADGPGEDGVHRGPPRGSRVGVVVA